MRRIELMSNISVNTWCLLYVTNDPPPFFLDMKRAHLNPNVTQYQIVTRWTESNNENKMHCLIRIQHTASHDHNGVLDSSSFP